MPTLVPREHLPNAISLNTIMFQTASVVGPALGGMLIAAAGVGWVYVANAISFGFVIVALLMMRDVPARQPSDAGRRETTCRWHAALEGLRFVFRSPLIRSTMLLDFFATFFSSATALLPIFAQDILHVGAKGYGWLYAAPAVGALLTSAVDGADGRSHRAARAGAAVGGGRLRPGDGRLRPVAIVLADVRLPRADRRDRHGQHGDPQHRPAARDARIGCAGG